MSNTPEDTSANSGAPITAGIPNDLAIMAVCDRGLPVSVARPTIRWDRSSNKVEGGTALPIKIASYGSFLKDGSGFD